MSYDAVDHLDEDLWEVFEAFLLLADSFPRKEGDERFLLAFAGTNAVYRLLIGGFVDTLDPENRSMFEEGYRRLFLFHDGHPDMIRAIEEHFTNPENKEKRSVVTNEPKTYGVRLGMKYTIVKNTEKVGYFVKSHQWGPTFSNPSHNQRFDTREVFIYRFLQNSGLGPETEFIVSPYESGTTLWLATKECPFIPGALLDESSVSNRALLIIDFVCQILRLADCANNPFNFGQVGKEPMIVDFRVDKNSTPVYKQDLIDQMLTSDSRSRHSKLIKKAHQASREEKLHMLRGLLQQWMDNSTVESTAREVRTLLRGFDSSVNLKLFEAYVQYLMEAIGKLTLASSIYFQKNSTIETKEFNKE